MNIYRYIEKNKNISFKEKEFNEVDNAILSLISYLNFSYIEGENTLQNMGRRLLHKYDFREISHSGWAQKDAYIIFEKIINTERYKNIEIQNYVYIATENEQFSAVTFIINKKLKYIAYEGTDHLMVGWKEAFELSYKYPVPSQIHAIKYLKNAVKIFGPKIIVGGHSKGGNLALVSAMELGLLKKLKIKKIYSNDGPGLRLKQFNSINYKLLKNKYIHIIPRNSLVGVMLRNDKYKVVKSIRRTMMSHIPSTWIIDNDKFVETDMSRMSKNLQRKVTEWLDNHNDNERQFLIENIFELLLKSGITDTMKLKNITYIARALKKLKTIDQKTKDLTIDLLTYIIFTK